MTREVGRGEYTNGTVVSSCGRRAKLASVSSTDSTLAGSTMREVSVPSLYEILVLLKAGN